MGRAVGLQAQIDERINRETGIDRMGFMASFFGVGAEEREGVLLLFDFGSCFVGLIYLE